MNWLCKDLQNIDYIAYTDYEILYSRCRILKCYTQERIYWRTIEDISTIQVLQNKVLRSCLRVKKYIDVPTHELHLQLNIQPFDKRMQYFLLCSIYINIKIEFLTPIVPCKMTKMHRAPILPLATLNSDWYYRSAVYFGIKTWNILPIKIRNSQSLDIFKASIKQYLFI